MRITGRDRSQRKRFPSATFKVLQNEIGLIVNGEKSTNSEAVMIASAELPNQREVAGAVRGLPRRILVAMAIAAVVSRGRYYSREDLDAMLERTAGLSATVH